MSFFVWWKNLNRLPLDFELSKFGNISNQAKAFVNFLCLSTIRSLTHTSVLGRMENPVTQAEWQEGSSWASCSGNPPVKKRTRFCGIPFKRSVQPNRNCKDQSGLRNGNRETNRESQVCSEEDLNIGNNGKDLIRTGFNRPNGIAQELSAPECYYPPGTKMQDDVFDDSQPLRIVGGKFNVFRM